MYCRTCGNENEAGASFCRSCGKPLAGTGSAPKPIDPSASTGNDAPKPKASVQPGDASSSAGFQTKPKLKPQNSAGLGLSAYIAGVALVLGIVLIFFGQQQIDAYAGYSWYAPYAGKAQLGSLLRGLGGISCLGGAIGLIRYFIMKK